MDTENVSMSNFPSIAFQSSLSTEAILFGVFGFLYSVYGLYSSLATPSTPRRPPIVKRLRQVCRFIVGFITFNAILTIYSLIRLNLSGLADIILGIGFAAIMIAIAVISGVWAFKFMD